MDELVHNPNSLIEVDPAELEPAFNAVVTSTLTKELGARLGRPWTGEQESDMQQNISELVAAAKALGLTTFRVIVTRPDGCKIARELDIDGISRSRSLQ